jgi:hypothetical protein
MQESDRIPRWIVENDPSWEKSIDSNLGLLRWTKKGTGIQATCTPTSIFCTIVGRDPSSAGLADFSDTISRMDKRAATGAGDITKYLSSRHLNPGINGPRFDLRKERKF